MKNVLKLFGVITFVVIIGFSFATCDSGTDEDGNSNGNGGNIGDNTSTTPKITIKNDTSQDL